MTVKMEISGISLADLGNQLADAATIFRLGQEALAAERVAGAKETTRPRRNRSTGDADQRPDGGAGDVGEVPAAAHSGAAGGDVGLPEAAEDRTPSPGLGSDQCGPAGDVDAGQEAAGAEANAAGAEAAAPEQETDGTVLAGDDGEPDQAPTVEDVKEAARKLGAKGGVAAVQTVFKAHGVAKPSDVAPEKIVAVLAALNEALGQ